MSGELDRFLVPIVSGMTPAVDGAGQLSPTRRAELDGQLLALDEARRWAWLTSQLYPIGRAR